MIKTVAVAIFVLCALSFSGKPMLAQAPDAKVDSGLEKTIMSVLDGFMAGTNALDIAAMESHQHFPHFRLANSGEMMVQQAPGQFTAEAFRSALGEEWHHSAWLERKIIHASDSKVHVNTTFARFRKDNSQIASFNSLYVVTLEDGKWGIKMRSSFAPAAMHPPHSGATPIAKSDPAPATKEGLELSANPEELFNKPIAVRNERPQQGTEIATLRRFRIQKGTYPEFYKRSKEDVWPFFEKIGSRVVGMWLVRPEALGAPESTEFDEVVLVTRYASLDHWKATRNAVTLGGNGPDAKAAADASAYRESVTIKTSFEILEGTPANNGPYFMPGVKE